MTKFTTVFLPIKNSCFAKIKVESVYSDNKIKFNEHLS